jgi:hypothetical protein
MPAPVAVRVIALALVLGITAGCGKLIDKNNLRVAVVDGEPITRGELYQYIRSFPENERPQIMNQGDLLMVLNRMIDERLKAGLVEQYGEEMKGLYTEDMAREEFFRSLGDEQEQYRAVWQMEVPSDGKPTPLMEVYGLTPESMTAMKQHIEERTRARYLRSRGDEVLGMLTAQAMQKGELTIDDKALELEYKFRQNELKRREIITVLGLRFPPSPDGATAAAEARKAVDAGADFAAMVEEARAKDASTVFQGTLQNDLANQDFRSFWEQASGAAVGSVLGPLFLPETQQVAVSQNGQQRAVNMPPAYLVCRVEEREDERVLTLEESRRILAPPLLVAEMVRRLREEHGVEIYEENLSSPGDFEDNVKPLA